jgi:hypothetical protein
VSCFAYTCEAARRVAKRPTLFMALALFAGAWVLAAAAIGVRLDAIKAEAVIQKAVEAPALTPAAMDVLISFTKRSATEFADRAAAVAAFLFVFTGACLAREVPHKRRLQRLQELLQAAGLFTLFYLVLPQRLPINPPSLTSTQMTMLTGEILSLLGLVSLGLGMSAVATGRWAVVAAIASLLIYEGLSVYRVWELWTLTDQDQRPPFPWLMAYGYLVVWCGMTALLCYLVVTHFRSVQLLELQETAASLRRAPP